MNFTINGMTVNDEAVTYRLDAAAAAQARIDFAHRWKTVMSETEQPSGDSQSPIEKFIKDFFGVGNIAWPNQDLDSD